MIATPVRTLLLLVAGVGLTACVSLPDVYLVDRHTVMESEASGEWPEIDARLKEQVSMGPEALPAEPDDERRRRALRALNGEFTTKADPARR